MEGHNKASSSSETTNAKMWEYGQIFPVDMEENEL